MRNPKKIFYVCVFVYVCTGVLLAWSIGYRGISQAYNIPVMPRSFSDITNLVWGAQSIADGYDPLYENPRDRFGRKMNHPRILQHIVSALHLHRFSVEQVAIAVICIFIAALCLVFRELDRWSAILLSVAVISPPVVLGVERCNHDLFVFSLVAFGVRFGRISGVFFALSSLAAFIKFFPVFSITYFLKYSARRWLYTSLAFGGIFIVYLILNMEDLGQIFRSTEKSFAYSYGAKVFMTPWVSAENALFSKVAMIPVFAMITTLGLSLISCYGESWHLKIKDSYIDAFRVGAGIYLGSYLIGNNWDYRLIYLLLTIPQLTHWSLNEGLAIARVALGVLFVSLFIHWVAPFGDVQFLIDESSNWILFGLFFVLIVRSVSREIVVGIFPQAASGANTIDSEGG